MKRKTSSVKFGKGWFTDKEHPNTFYKLYKKYYGLMIYVEPPVSEEEDMWEISVFHLPSCNEIFLDTAPDFLSAVNKLRERFRDKRI